MGGYVYILASGTHGALYIGATNNLARRVFEHRAGVGSAFARRYGSIASSITRFLRTSSTPFTAKSD